LDKTDLKYYREIVLGAEKLAEEIDARKMRDYQRKKQTKYILPRAVYHQTLWRIRDYYRLVEAADNLIECRDTDIDGMPRGTDINDKTCNTVIKRAKFMEEVCAINDILKEIPVEYRKGVWNNIQFFQPYPLDADRATYGRYKSKLIYKAAERFGLI
jgi:hypothetical protein